MRPLPITDYSIVNAIGTTRDEVADALAHGRSGLVQLPGPSEADGEMAKPLDASEAVDGNPLELHLPFSTAVGVVQKPLPPLEGELARWNTRLARFAAELLRQIEPTLARARERWRPERTAILLGTSTAGAEQTENAYRHFKAKGNLPASYDFWRQHTYGALLHVVRTLTGFTGPAWMVSTACSSSSKPIASAQRLIEAGAIDAAIVGGIDTLCHLTVRGFDALGALSTRPCRPFDAERDGISIGEGGAFLVVERDAEPIAWVEGTGESSDAYHISAPHPEGQGAQLAMERAMDGICNPSDIDHVNAHGTGTPLNDQAESQAITRLLGKDVPIISTKGYTGHTLGAAGAIEVAMCLLAMERGFIAPSIGKKTEDPKIEANVVLEKTPAQLKRVLTNSFAFGGNNISILLRSV